MGNDANARDPSRNGLATGGLLLVDKPCGMTSHDVVAAVRKHVRPLKVGHTGTLDPIATGLLVLCVGEATKIAGFIEARDKQYRATALLGVRTDTQDVAGEVIAEARVEGLTEEDVREAARSFVGKIEQTPPAFSAIKVDGVRAYKRARKKQDVRLKSRTIEIKRLDVESVTLPRVEFLLECSKGTYVRTLCSDLGDALGVGGCMESLRRVATGHFNINDAQPLDGLDTREKIMSALAPASGALSQMPAIKCDSGQAEKLSHGMALKVDDQTAISADDEWAQALGPDGGLLAVGKLKREGDGISFYPKRVLTGVGK